MKSASIKRSCFWYKNPKFSVAGIVFDYLIGLQDINLELLLMMDMETLLCSFCAIDFIKQKQCSPAMLSLPFAQLLYFDYFINTPWLLNWQFNTYLVRYCQCDQSNQDGIRHSILLNYLAQISEVYMASLKINGVTFR